jgi:TetR/AcrR family fatty acid metabolism transcriptional regulator
MAGPKKIEERKAQILAAAETVFARKGFSEATISDVARQAGVSDATIYEYFASKEELLFTIPGETTRMGTELLEFNLRYIRGAGNKMRGLIYHYLAFYQEHPDYAAVSMLILKQNRKFLETEAYRHVREGYGLFLRVIEEGVQSGEFRADLDKYLVRAAILGAIEHQVTRRALMDKPANLVDLVDPLTDLLLGGLKRPVNPAAMNFKITVEPISSSDD